MSANFEQHLCLVLQRDTVRAASEFAKRNQLPSCIQNQLLSHICLKFRTEGLKQQETLNSLPKAIRSSISHYLFFPVVQNARLFQGVSLDYLFQLVFPISLSFVFILTHLFAIWELIDSLIERLEQIHEVLSQTQQKVNKQK